MLSMNHILDFTSNRQKILQSYFKWNDVYQIEKKKLFVNGFHIYFFEPAINKLLKTEIDNCYYLKNYIHNPQYLFWRTSYSESVIIYHACNYFVNQKQLCIMKSYAGKLRDKLKMEKLYPSSKLSDNDRRNCATCIYIRIKIWELTLK